MDEPPVMPDFVTFTRGFRHTVDSALESLARLGVAGQVFLESAGPGSPPGSVVEQVPAPGTTLERQTPVTLRIAGAGGQLSLPFVMRSRTRKGHSDTAGEGRGLTRPPLESDRLLALFDDQVLRLSAHIRRGGGYLTLEEGRTEPSQRWVEEIFALPRGAWTPDQLHRLARFLPRLHRLAGSPEGVRRGLHAVLGLEAGRLELAERLALLPEDEWTRLGGRASRLGVDAVVGRGIPAEIGLEITYHLPDAAAYHAQAAPLAQRRRRALYLLLLPAHLHPDAVRERWKIGSPLVAARLGHPQHATLGRECYVGASAPGAHL